MKYRIYALTPSQYEITGAVETCEIKEMHEELAMESTITLANVKYQNDYLSSILIPPYKTMITADGTEIFQGHIIETDYDSSRKKTITLTCFDPTWFMQQSKVAYYCPKDKNSNEVIQDIAALGGFAIFNKAPSISMPATKYQSNSYAEVIIDVLKKVKEQTGIECVLRSSSGTIEVLTKGSNTTMYRLDITNVENANQNISMQDMVTKVKIIYTDSEGGNISNEAELSNNTTYGELQEIINRSSNQTLEQARSEAQSILDEKSKPKEAIGFQSVDIPFLRKSDRISIAAGSLTGEVYVEAITHDIRENKMRVELSR